MSRYLKALLAFLALLAAFAAACVLMGCVDANADVPTVHRFAWSMAAPGDSPLGKEAYVVTDQSTGVQYLVINTSHGTAVTPLVDLDGDPAKTAGGV